MPHWAPDFGFFFTRVQKVCFVLNVPNVCFCMCIYVVLRFDFFGCVEITKWIRKNCIPHWVRDVFIFVLWYEICMRVHIWICIWYLGTIYTCMYAHESIFRIKEQRGKTSRTQWGILNSRTQWVISTPPKEFNLDSIYLVVLRSLIEFVKIKCIIEWVMFVSLYVSTKCACICVYIHIVRFDSCNRFEIARWLREVTACVYIYGTQNSSPLVVSFEITY